MEPLTMMLIAGGLAAAGKAGGSAIQSSAAKKAAAKTFTQADVERLAELERLRNLSELGLSEEQRMAVDAELRAARAAAAREGQAERLAMQAASPTSARDVFLQQYAAEQARQQGVTAENLVRQQAEQQAAAQQLAEIQQLRAARAAAAGIPVQFAGQAVSEGVGGAGEALGDYASMQHQLDVLEAQTGTPTDEELQQLYDTTAPNPYGSYV